MAMRKTGYGKAPAIRVETGRTDLPDVDPQRVMTEVGIVLAVMLGLAVIGHTIVIVAGFD